jgi:hypothetical protein
VLADAPRLSGGRLEQVLQSTGIPARMSEVAHDLRDQMAVTYVRPSSATAAEKLDVSVSRKGVKLRAPRHQTVTSQAHAIHHVPRTVPGRHDCHHSSGTRCAPARHLPSGAALAQAPLAAARPGDAARNAGAMPAGAGAQARKPPITALYVTGGGFHDFVKQEAIVPPGIAERIRIEWTIDHTAGKSTEVLIEGHRDTAWTKAFDVVVYNMSFLARRGRGLDRAPGAHAPGQRRARRHPSRRRAQLPAIREPRLG